MYRYGKNAFIYSNYQCIKFRQELIAEGVNETILKEYDFVLHRL